MQAAAREVCELSFKFRQQHANCLSSSAQQAHVTITRQQLLAATAAAPCTSLVPLLQLKHTPNLTLHPLLPAYSVLLVLHAVGSSTASHLQPQQMTVVAAAPQPQVVMQQVRNITNLLFSIMTRKLLPLCDTRQQICAVTVTLQHSCNAVHEALGAGQLNRSVTALSSNTDLVYHA
jgi:hypothetical protein